VQAAIGLYTADGVFMPVGAPTAQGTEALRAAYGAVFQAIQLNVTFTIDEIRVHGNVAFARTRSAGTTLIRATDNTVSEGNRELFVLEKQDGTWRIARYMFNKEPG
jgi:uncharacterized protein (TIGR02246 family)